MSKEKRFIPSHSDFVSELKKKFPNIKLTESQNEISELILDSREVLLLTHCRTGRTFIFQLIDSYISHDLSPDHWTK